MVKKAETVSADFTDQTGDDEINNIIEMLNRGRRS